MAIFSNRDSIFECEVATLTSTDPSYVRMLQSYFDVLWNNADVQKLNKWNKTRGKKQVKKPADNLISRTRINKCNLAKTRKYCDASAFAFKTEGRSINLTIDFRSQNWKQMGIFFAGVLGG